MHRKAKMSQPAGDVQAKDCKGKWIRVEVETDPHTGKPIPIRVMPTVVKESGRGFVKVTFKHDSIGTHTLEFARGQRLALWP